MSRNMENGHVNNVSDCDFITFVFWTLDNHKNRAISELFGDVVQTYRNKWLKRGHFEFWAHLDAANKVKLVELAKEIYS